MDHGELSSLCVFRYSLWSVTGHYIMCLWPHRAIYKLFPKDTSRASFRIFPVFFPSIQHVFIAVFFSPSAFFWSLTSTAGSFPFPLPQAKSLLSGVASDGGWLWSPGPTGKVQALQGPYYPAGGYRDGAELATAEPGCPVPLAASQNFALSYYNQMEEEWRGTTG